MPSSISMGWCQVMRAHPPLRGGYPAGAILGEVRSPSARALRGLADAKPLRVRKGRVPTPKGVGGPPSEEAHVPYR